MTARGAPSPAQGRADARGKSRELSGPQEDAGAAPHHVSYGRLRGTRPLRALGTDGPQTGLTSSNVNGHPVTSHSFKK